jgi:AcrR family transcriptional regulator
MSVTELPSRRAREGRAMQKGQQTKAAIVDAALAEVTQMSKSGVFAHFGSREELQISVIREYHTRFEEEVFYPAMSEPRGLPRLRAMFANWMKRTSIEIDSGCIYISGAVEFDDRAGPVRDALASSVQTWHAAMTRAITMAKEEGHLRPDTDEDQMLFEIHGLILALHYEARFLKNPRSIARANAGFENILRQYGAQNASAPAKKSPKKG